MRSSDLRLPFSWPAFAVAVVGYVLFVLARATVHEVRSEIALHDRLVAYCRSIGERTETVYPEYHSYRCALYHLSPMIPDSVVQAARRDP